MSQQVVLCEKLEGKVGLITLNRPESMNSWTDGLRKGIFDSLDTLGADPDVRVIVITGKGRAFCAGADMGGLEAQSGGDKDAFSGSMGDAAKPDTRLLTHATTIPKPVIAAINGPAAGLGLALACSCDFRFCSKQAKLTSAFSKLGLIAEHGLSWALPHMMGTGNAMMMLMSSDVVTGEEAEKYGLVQKTFDSADLLNKTLEYARNLALTVPAANLAVIKQQVWRHPLMERDDALRQSNRLMSAATSDNPDFSEGVAAFLGKRPPNFGPLDPNNKIIKAAEQEFGFPLTSKL